ncbi:MAG: YbjN domain-containing protein [Bacteroidaceae bacterium]|nr:YbjN domain-containing protein [Bacteroidaceae bacterium]
MNAKELVLDFLRKEGFTPTVDERNNIVFKYQMTTYVFFTDENDDEFFQLTMPAIYDVTEDNRELVLEAANKVNQSMKVIKIIVTQESVWVLFEILLDETPQVEDIMPRAFRIMEDGRNKFYELIE